MLKIVVLSLLCGITYGTHFKKPSYIIKDAQNYFDDFVATYNKNYSNEQERQERFKIFTLNLIKFNEMNAAGSSIHGVNQFADLTSEEFLAMYTGYIPSQVSSCRYSSDDEIVTNTAPEAFDWRDKSAVTPIKNQGHCGSCYAFAAIGNIESQYAIKKGAQLDLSEQQLVSCSQQNYGCGGGESSVCMLDIMNSGGVESEANYPYLNLNNSKPHTCSFDVNLVTVKLSGCVSYQMEDEDKLKELLYTTGPIAMNMDASELSSYQSGVFSHCTNSEINHAVLLVGYGTDPTEGPYWLVKNSWSTSWGEKGFFRMPRGSNACMIMDSPKTNAIIA